MKTKIIFTTLVLVLVLVLAVSFFGCKKDDYVETIGVCPEVISTNPADDAINVPLDKIISAKFNEKMNPATITTTSYTISLGGTLISGVVTYSDSTAYFSPNQPLLPDTTYTATIKTTVKDPMGNAIQEDYIWNFTTDANPTIILTSPANLETGVPINKIITAKFSEAMSLFSMNTTTFIVRIGTTPITGTVIFADSTASFIPSVPLELNTTYNCTITTGAKNLNGSPLVVNYNWSFVTSARIALSSSPEAGGTTSGGGIYSQGAIVTTIAIPNIGYSFTNWTEGTTVVSTTPSYQFTMSGNRYLVANFVKNIYTLTIISNNGNVAINPNQTSFDSGTNVSLTATPNIGYTFTSWSGDATGSINPLNVTMNSDKNITANFTAILPNTFTLNVIANNGIVVKNPNQLTYNTGSSVILTATPNSGYTFTSWSGDATGSINPLNVTMNSDKNITANFIKNSPLGPVAINLGSAIDFSVFTKSGISTTGVTSIIGNIGVSPMTASGITGFGLIMDVSNEFSHTPIVSGKVYAADYYAPTPAKLTAAISDMETAYTTANGLTTPAPIVSLGAGNISGMTLAPGLYKWDTGLLISNSGLTLSGGENDTWVFQIGQDFTINSSAILHLIGGAQAKNIFWIVAGKTTFGTDVNFSGIILCKTLISLNSRTYFTGRLFAQTAVTLNASTVVQP